MSEEQKVYYEQVGVAMTCRSLDEYVRMFDLDVNFLKDEEIEVLDVAAGASSFAADVKGHGIRAVAVDPRYAYEPAQLYKLGLDEIELSSAKVQQLLKSFRWDYYGSPENHRRMREASLERFIKDYSNRHSTNDYVAGSLPELPFASGRFSLVLCSHFLFLYAAQFSLEFHQKAIEEMLRICRPGGEVRIYPLSDLKWNKYPFIEQLTRLWEKDGIQFQFRHSRLPFIPESDRMLCLRKS